MDGDFGITVSAEQIADFGLVKMCFGIQGVVEQLLNYRSMKALITGGHITHGGAEQSVGQHGTGF